MAYKFNTFSILSFTHAGLVINIQETYLGNHINKRQNYYPAEKFG